MPTFRRSMTVPHPVSDVFAWHERPGALERLTPPWENMRVVRRSGGIADGAVVEIRHKKGPLDLSWEMEHVDYEQGRRFVDVQRKGPFQSWRHTHEFAPTDDGGTLVTDTIEWEPPLGAAGEVLAGPILEKELEQGFAFRHRRLAHDLDLHARWAGAPRLTVAITGAGGLIGSALSHLLTTGGHRVVRMVRSRSRATDGAVYWNADTGEVDTAGLRGVDAVVHLAGEPISGVRWTDAKKRAIRESRVKGTAAIAGAIAGMHDVKTLVMASAVGYYGGRKDEILTETSAPGKGFLAEVCVEWEAAARRAEGAGVRVVKIRNGLVLSPAGGALPLMLTAFKSGLAGRVGNGRQYVPWIDLDDCVGIFYTALMNGAVKGVLNGTGPHPVTNATFTDVLGRVLNRPTVVPLPKLAVRAMLGEMGDELLLKGQRARPAATLAAGYDFRREDLEASLRHQLGRPG
ncbi:TIGR01777 family oxidoreductase [Gaopeijia maritima]|uniref:TIGR01777 family oxidoreductase n=1 Tax=Gaopeijia maritima TaxID=3119007 RepID=A0ABU9E6K2_9BACT